ncbi:MAG: acetyl/propionyl/methylcrotonyl-CoA carboxylase subunit alpha [Gammaproteobacteria bacterium]|nr:acetyl/propionyl/methylcrotonyl-CoA carboxylase subunit alpha [Gammaproteobacteria bacterium]
MFKKILIANRGEIACRVIKSARKMGIKTVAIYSDADREALHVQMADEAVHIGPSPSAESYLIAEKIITACKETGAEAVHPGYGFLSENSAFSESLAAEGIAFIGPGKKAIESMGDKITSKLIAADAGVSTVPGYTGIIKDADHAVEIAADIGYPVMLKASAGGGGKGMRVVWNDDECRDGFLRATNEAVSSFGDDRVFAEKFVQEPRHIEIQVLADSKGNTIYLGERECSIQRRHQKVIEEAPSPFLDEATRKSMGEQSIALAKAVDYQSAGTVEFIVDADRNFYFLEMNTRLQVEHPVTEKITGLDLVELMIHIAAGEELPIKQEDVTLKGWALEARVYAEDPFRNFMPSIGRLSKYAPPEETESVRVDTGIEEGSEVSMYYDPMIAKLITYGKDRQTAIDLMCDALDNYHIRGVSHNISFLNALIAHPRFAEGRLTTNFIAEEYPEGFNAADIPQSDPSLVISIAAVINRMQMDRAAKLSGQLPSHERLVSDDWVIVIEDDYHEVNVVASEDGFAVTQGKNVYSVNTNWRIGDALIHADINGKRITFQIDTDGPAYKLYHRGAEIRVLPLTPRAAELNRYMIKKEPPDLSKFLLSPMPGLLVKMQVSVGDEVKAGEEIAVVEAMKMENSLRADEDVVISKVMAEQGESLVVDQPILEFE